jgi:hypothetical protein
MGIDKIFDLYTVSHFIESECKTFYFIFAQRERSSIEKGVIRIFLYNRVF